jgi:hypothetical protein
VLVAGLALAPTAWGFHDGGVATCGGCHVTHNSIDGQQVVPGAGNEFSLKAGSATDVCLSCHAQTLGAVLGVHPLAPSPEKGAGNFVFLLENNLNDAPGGAGAPIGGEAAGHSVVAPAHGLAADSRYPVAPGGTFAASELGCTSCHDPHGRGSFRMLYGAGPVQAGAAHFGAAAPVADGLALSPSVSEQRGAHSAYRSGMSDWCGNCHGRYHESDGSSAFSHPIDAPLSATVRTQYDLYDGVTNPAGGNPSTSYLPAVPFEDGTAAVGSTAGPTVSSRLSCLSCHRAHASSAPAAGRWDFNVSTLGADGVESGSWPIPNPYVDPTQPALCWKCHPGGTGP